MNIFCIDDFYTNPYDVRELALKETYQNFGEHQNFPGQESIKSFYSNAIIEKFENLIGNTILIEPEKFIFGKFRYSIESDNAPTSIHLDSGVNWTGIVYLSKDEDVEGGLGIYRHKMLQLNESPDEKKLKELACKDIAEFDARYVYPISTDLDKWELISEIPIKFNRLILFQGSKYFHAINKQFGKNIQNGRLTQNFFFN